MIATTREDCWITYNVAQHCISWFQATVPEMWRNSEDLADISQHASLQNWSPAYSVQLCQWRSQAYIFYVPAPRYTSSWGSIGFRQTLPNSPVALHSVLCEPDDLYHMIFVCHELNKPTYWLSRTTKTTDPDIWKARNFNSIKTGLLRTYLVYARR